MARDRANLRTDMIGDDRYRELTRDEQWLYKLLLIHPTLSYAGVAEWRPGRLASAAAGTTADDVRRIGAGLQAKYFVYIDEDTEEVLVRSFVKHDGLLKQFRLPISMANDYAGIASQDIREFFVFELQKYQQEEPTLKCWDMDRVKGVLERASKDMKQLSYGDTLPITFAEGYADTYGKGYGIDQKEGYGLATATTTATTTNTSFVGFDSEAPSEEEEKRPRKKPETKLPESWQPTEEHAKRAREKNLNLEEIATDFRLHAETHDRRAANWNSAFTMWLRKAQPKQATAWG